MPFPSRGSPRWSMLASALISAGCIASSMQSSYEVADVGSFHVAVEGSGAPDPDKVDIPALKNIHFLFVWDDFIDQNTSWKQYLVAPDKFQQALRVQGGVADRLDLPQHGIKGNSHMLMMDRNSDQVAALVQAWMDKNGLMK